MSLAMSRAGREAFLADTHVAVISIAEAGRGPLTIPVWYRYSPGGKVRIVSYGDAKKVALVRKAGRMSLCAQTETPPYQYVSVEGPAVVSEKVDAELDERQVAIRYLGKELGEAYLAMMAEERAEHGTVVIELTPERWITVDYRQMGG
jgi:nitroimidazol reductase NimA-like FMN-containing flavoprotein (pyridoxamine 5'-phosphate oxidase superfamily)